MLTTANRKWREARMVVKGLQSLRHPVLAQIVPIRRCNLACAHCNEFDNHSAPVPVDTMLERIDQAYVRDGVGEQTDFIYMTDSLVDRIPTDEGQGKDAHVFASLALGADLVVQVHFSSQPVGPAFPTFAVRLGRPPEVLPSDWRRVHVAAITSDVPGHDGILRELSLGKPE